MLKFFQLSETSTSVSTAPNAERKRRRWDAEDVGETGQWDEDHDAKTGHTAYDETPVFKKGK